MPQCWTEEKCFDELKVCRIRDLWIWGLILLTDHSNFWLAVSIKGKSPRGNSEKRDYGMNVS